MDWWRTVAFGIAVSLLAGCGGGGCFGLCDERDDDDDQAPDTELGPDRSCFADSLLAPTESLPYALTTPVAAQTLDFRAASSANSSNLRPLLIWVTGDDWQQSTAPANAPTVATSIAQELGAHLALVGYRADASTQWPQPIQDINTAVRFLKTEALTRNIDTDRVYLGGDQAGAHLAALSAVATDFTDYIGVDHLTENNDVNALIGLGGVYDLFSLLEDSEAVVERCGMRPDIAVEPVRELLDCGADPAGGEPLSGCDLGLLTEASPIAFISPSSPPTLLWHGDQDCDVPPQQSADFFDELDRTSVAAVLNTPMNDDETLASLTAEDVEIELAGLLPCM